MVKSGLKSMAGQMRLSKSKEPRTVQDINGPNRERKLSAKAFEHIIGSIVDGTFAPSSKISPKRIAAKLGMSLAPVRDAMEQLEKDGWIVRFPQRGTYVRQISVQDVDEIYELREILETGAAAIAIARAKPEDLQTLKETVESLTEAAHSGDLQTYEKLDTQFHLQLVKLTGNESLINSFECVLFKTRSFFIAMKATSYGQQSTPDLEDIPVSHKRIHEAIVGGQVELAEKLIRRHIAISCEWNKAQIRIQQLSSV